RITHELEKRSEPMQHLTAEKVQRPQRFKEQQGGQSHATSGDDTGNLLQQGEVLGSEGRLGRWQSEGVRKFLTQFSPEIHTVCMADLFSVGNASGGRTREKPALRGPRPQHL